MEISLLKYTEEFETLEQTLERAIAAGYEIHSYESPLDDPPLCDATIEEALAYIDVPEDATLVYLER